MQEENKLSTLFDAAPTVLKTSAEREPLIPDTEENKPFIDTKLSLAQIKEREARTVFVGNVSIHCKRKTLKKLFEKHGAVESIWFRSVPVNNESKVPIKGKIATKDFVDFNDSMNAYVLFEAKEAAESAVQENNKEFLGKFVRVSLANQKVLDIKTTVFVGNLYYKVKDEDLRDFFKDCGTVVSVRVIRDPITHMGKGFAYVRFENKQGYLKALQKNKAEFFQRELRIKKAVEIEQENKNKAFVDKERRDKEYQVDRSRRIMNEEEIEQEKIDEQKIRDFSKGRTFTDEMTAERAEEIFKTKGKVPSTMIKSQMKKVKKQGIKGAEATEKINWIKEKAQRRLGERVFYKRDELKNRREVRKIKKVQNVKKYKAMKARMGSEDGPNKQGPKLKRG